MKNLIIVLFSFLALEMNANCFNKDSKWEYLWVKESCSGEVENVSKYSYTFNSDTIINDIAYWKMYKNTSYIAALRETEDSKVYAVYCEDNKEVLLYDFAWEVGKTLKHGFTSSSEEILKQMIDYEIDMGVYDDMKNYYENEIYDYCTIEKIETLSLNDREYSYLKDLCIQYIGNTKQDFFEHIILMSRPTCGPEYRYLFRYSIGDELIYESQDLIRQYLSSIPETQTINFTISPNPAGESFEVKVEDVENIASISLFDEVGKLVKRLPIENTISVDCAGLTSGVYVCQIIDKQGVATTKQVIVK